MIDLYYWPTPNGWKATIMLEECELDYRVFPVDIGAGDQFRPEFLRVSPNNRMPAIVDHAPVDEGEPISVFESGAILEYLGDKTGKFLPRDPRKRSQVLQWVHWQMANLGPMMGNANHFKNYARNLVSDESQLEYARKRFTGECERLAGVMDGQLSIHPYLGGAEFSIADITSWPWATLLGNLFGDEVWQEFGNLARWREQLRERPLLEKGFQKCRELGEREISEEEAGKRRELLFNQTNEKVRSAREEALKQSAGPVSE